jgi:hypothetical protein
MGTRGLFYTELPAPREGRERLRDAVRDQKKYPELAKAHKPRSPWQWVKGSAGEKEARGTLQPKKV